MFQHDAGVPAGSGKKDVHPPAQQTVDGRSDKKQTRQHIIDDVVETLTSGSGCGVVLVGEHGAGKSFIAQRALERLGEDYLVVQVRGSSISSKLPYGALSVLLNDLESSHLEHPLMVLRGLTQLLHAKAQGRTIVLFVDNAHDLDDLSCMMVAQLSAGGHVTLLAACVDLPHVGGDIMGLWKDDLLRRVDLEPFDFAETAATLHQEYGGHFSNAAARALWTASGGNALFLHSLAREQIKLGVIAKQDGTWVLGPRAISLTGEVRDVVKARLNRLSPGQRDVFELLSLAGAVSLQTLMGIFDPHDMDTLQERGLITVSHEHPPTVRVSNTVTAAIVRSVVPPGRSAELRRRLTAVRGPGNSLEPGGPTGVAWALDCGEQISPELALAAARRANGSSDPASALRFLRAVEDSAASPGAVIEAARAHLESGNAPAARRLLQDFELDGSGASITERVDAGILLAGVDGVGSSGGTTADERLDSLASWLTTAVDPQSVDAIRARAKLGLAKARLAARHGHYMDILQARDALGAENLGAEQGIVAGALVCEALAATGDAAAAAMLGQQLLVATRDPDLSDEALGEVRERLLLSAVHSARFRDASQLLASASELPDGSVRVGGVFEIGEGMLSLHAGRLAEALETLTAGIEQLRVDGDSPLLALGNAAVAYTASLQGKLDYAAAILADHGAGNPSAPWLTARLTKYFELCAKVELGQRAAAIRELAAEAEDEIQRGANGTALLFQSGAARLGDRQSCQKLGVMAQRVSGPFAALCHRVANSLRDADSEALLAVVKDAESGGDAIFARDIARQAVTCASDSGNRLALRVAQRAEQKLDELFGGPRNGVQALTSSVLTARECEVAVRAAAGNSNRKIAEQMHVSVRTVEGHLYQVYAKLHLGSRAELKDAIAGSAGPAGNARIG